MAKARNPDRIRAEEIYLEHKGNIELVKIAEIIGRPPGTVRGWKSKDRWDEKLNGTFQEKKRERSKKKKGGQPDNKNAVGHGAPPGNLNSLKHGAYQSLYADMLNTEDRILFNVIQPSVNVDDEIRLLRLKIARLLNREKSFFYNMFGEKIDKEISEEDRITGINACMDQLRKLIEAKAKIATDTEKIELDKDKFEFNKYKTDIDLQLKKERLEMEKAKLKDDEIDNDEDDGFIEALQDQVDDIWQE